MFCAEGARKNRVSTQLGITGGKNSVVFNENFFSHFRQINNANNSVAPVYI